MNRPTVDAARHFPAAQALAEAEARSLSQVALGMVPSRILVIAYAVRDRIARGEPVVEFTVGDFAPGQFQVPAALKAHAVAAYEADQTNYPPANGLLELRQAILDHYRRDLGLDYPLDAVVVSSGVRPVLYSAYRCLLDPGEVVLTPVPSWNNNNFAQLVGAELVTVPSRPEDAFMPTAEALAPHIGKARLLVINSPLNPAGTVITRPQMEALCDLVLTENRRREAAGERLLYLVYDQVYRMLTFGDAEHLTPVAVRPEMAAYTLFADGISKGFAATGLRVGWMVAPPHITDRIRSLMTHVGAWAPKPEQVASAALLADDGAISAYLTEFLGALQARLDRLADAFAAWKAEGLPVDVIMPQGAIYLSVKFDLIGTPGVPDEDALVEWLLDRAGCAVIPFSAFGDDHNPGWVRFSVGAVSLADIDACLARLGPALQAVRG
ncbi:MAG: aminotransferase class I/II-fold pyridoxal phosphate-dependent enzyme [Myxococcales bacterium]|nr:aminotransferase class I/II-fold pyridoxal phosphate-dependent enzyme [Myxococcales bacterium]MCB9524818.1 aminotransferase class I/II-fold pyridoxal phosphate-dependent enzyme [Myxococcales bacterium]